MTFVTRTLNRKDPMRSMTHCGWQRSAKQLLARLSRLNDKLMIMNRDITQAMKSKY